MAISERRREMKRRRQRREKRMKQRQSQERIPLRKGAAGGSGPRRGGGEGQISGAEKDVETSSG